MLIFLSKSEVNINAPFKTERNRGFLEEKSVFILEAILLTAESRISAEK
jgi:hypothetical protein